MVEIYDNINPSNPLLIRSTNWLIGGLAQKYCIGGTILGGWQDGMVPDHPYLIRLILKNDCVETNKSLQFTLPIRDCTITGVPSDDKKLLLIPNPAIDNVNIHYELSCNSEVRLLVTHQIFTNFNYSVIPLVTQVEGEYNVDVPIQTFYAGLNVVILQVDGAIYTSTFIKQ